LAIYYQVEHVFWKAIDWLYPPACAGCGKPGSRFCNPCADQVSVIKADFCLVCNNSFSSHHQYCPICSSQKQVGFICTSWGQYQDTLREAIHKLKYDGDVGLGDYFAEKLISILIDHNWEFDLVVPVPLSKKRQAERGYNQSALISGNIAHFFNVQHSTSTLVRIKDTDTQFSLAAADRISNVKDAFSGNPAKLKGKRVLLVDDIITTGATLLNCQKAIINAGASNVFGISVAKTVKKIGQFENSAQ
jgi:ComF family protein